MDKFLIELGATKTLKAVLQSCRKKLLSLGVTRASYFIAPSFSRPTGKNVIVVQFGFPGAALLRYRDQEFRDNDPVANFVMKTARTGTWLKIIKSQKLSLAQKDYIKFTQAQGLFDGVAIPLFGPNGRDAYCTVSLSDREILPEDENLIRLITTICQASYRRICRLMDDQVVKPITISKRETEVLFWMAHSKSNTDIATILGVSPATVDTHVRRIYSKFEVNDRIAAIVRGLSLGLVRL